MITVERLRELLDYNMYTGVFRWKGRTPSSRFYWPGALVSLSQHGRYVRVCLEGKMYLAHRLAWVYVYGSWPRGDLDHIDGDTKNNAIANLREASKGDNHRNSKPYANNKTGYRGVMFEERKGLYKAQITFDKKNRFLGYFQTAEKASEAYQNKLNELTLKGQSK